MISKFVRGLFTVTVLFTFLVALSAARAQVTPGSVMVGASVGYNHTSISQFSTSETWNRYNIGATGGYNVDQWIGAFFEYNYISVLSQDGLTVHANTYGGAARFYLLPKSKIVPYGVFDGGGASTAFSGGDESESFSGSYVGGGGGVAYYLTKNLGAAADIRFNRYAFSVESENVNPHIVTVDGGVFYQFGGKKAMK